MSDNTEITLRPIENKRAINVAAEFDEQEHGWANRHASDQEPVQGTGGMTFMQDRNVERRPGAGQDALWAGLRRKMGYGGQAMLPLLQRRRLRLPALVTPLVAMLACLAAHSQPVVYTSTDQEYAEVVLAEATKTLGSPVVAVYDAEASKTVGLERRLVAEKGAPKADVFWNSEFLRTHRLDKQGLLAPTAVPASFGLPAAVLSPHSVGIGIRGRVIAVHAPSVAEAERPRRLEDLADPRFKGRVAIARPLFGTTSTHFAALHARWGESRFTAFLQALKKNEVRILPGNGDVRDAVVAGRVAVGLTDTDDAIGAVRRGQPLVMVFPDQDGDGAFGIYMTIAKVKGGPNPAAAQRLVEYLASEKGEQRLIELGAVQLSVRADGPSAKEIGPQRPRLWFMDPERIDTSLEPSIALMRKHLL